MKRTTIISLVLAVFCPCMASVADEVSYLPYIDINGASVSKAGANVELSMTVDVSELRIGTQHTVALIPVIVSKDGASEAEFPPIVIDGRTRSKVYYRAQVLESVELPPYHDSGAETIMLRDNGEQQSYDYAAAIPYARWMLDGRLEIREEVHGCVNCQEGRDSLDMFPVLPEYIPDYRLAAIEPEPEPVKTRMETRTARLNFRQDSHTIRPDYKDNRAQLDTVKNSIEAVRDDRDLEITGIFITGYASPEASEAYNKALSQRRADALREWIAADEDIDLSLVHSEGKGEDWNGFVSSLDGVRMLAGLDRIGLKHNVPQGSYFVLVDISDFLELDEFRGWSDLEFCEWMVTNIGVAAVPGSSFFREDVNNLIRLHFARSEKTLDEALERLGKLGALLRR